MPYSFDDLRRPIKESNPRTSTVTTTTYYTTTAGAGDYKGRVKTVSDALGNMTTYEY